MAFNAASYRRNQWRKAAKRELDRARDIKRRRLAGEAYEWESVESAVRLARSSWRLYLSQRIICELSKGVR